MSDFDRFLRQSSEQLSKDTIDAPDDEQPHKGPAVIDEALYELLKRWRLQRALKERVPPYIIAHNTVLSAVAAERPQSLKQLAGLSGFGPRKVELFGSDIIDIVQSYLQATDGVVASKNRNSDRLEI
jgi:superfamily II DNA helicase RecQ